MRAFIIVATAALASGTVSAADAPVSYKTQIQPLLNSQCVFCHVTGAENGGLNLGGKAAYRGLVDAPSTESKLLRVAPGRPDESYLMHKLKGTHLSVGGSGDPMPKTDPPRLLEAAQIEMFRKWIAQGAPKE